MACGPVERRLWTRPVLRGSTRTRRSAAWGAIHPPAKGKLRELRFYVGRDRTRITYYIATGRRIILLTVFRKTKRREAAEIDRAQRVMRLCISEGHAAEEIDER
jgi:hypothetical protein